MMTVVTGREIVEGMMVPHHDCNPRPFHANKADFDFSTFIGSRYDTGDPDVEKVDPFDVLGLVF